MHSNENQPIIFCELSVQHTLPSRGPTASPKVDTDKSASLAYPEMTGDSCVETCRSRTGPFAASPCCRVVHVVYYGGFETAPGTSYCNQGCVYPFLQVSTAANTIDILSSPRTRPPARYGTVLMDWCCRNMLLNVVATDAQRILSTSFSLRTHTFYHFFFCH